MTLSKSAIAEIERELNRLNDLGDEAHAEHDYDGQNNAYLEYHGMMKVVRILGYDTTYDYADADDRITLHIKKTSELFHKTP